MLAFDTLPARLQCCFMADGPVGFAPAVWNGWVYAGFGDGYLCCLRAGEARRDQVARAAGRRPGATSEPN